MGSSSVGAGTIPGQFGRPTGAQSQRVKSWARGGIRRSLPAGVRARCGRRTAAAECGRPRPQRHPHARGGWIGEGRTARHFAAPGDGCAPVERVLLCCSGPDFAAPGDGCAPVAVLWPATARAGSGSVSRHSIRMLPARPSAAKKCLLSPRMLYRRRLMHGQISIESPVTPAGGRGRSGAAARRVAGTAWPH